MSLCAGYLSLGPIEAGSPLVIVQLIEIIASIESIEDDGIILVPSFSRSNPMIITSHSSLPTGIVSEGIQKKQRTIRNPNKQSHAREF
jgi:hypothetical protein